MKLEYVRGTFLREHKTRFLCDVLLEGEEVECYIPSSCKLSKLIDLTGKEVILKTVENKNSRTNYSVYAARLGRYSVLLNLAEANRVVEDQLHRRYFSFLGKRQKVSREKIIEGYKADLYIEETKTLIEIKTLLSFEKEGSFPSMVSDRAERQLEKISDLLDKGYKVCYMVIALNPRVESININKEFDRYFRLFQTCLNKGMEYRGFSINLKNMKPEIHKTIGVSC
jgi:DNA-binding sugar fermentation-stimulating protein